MIEQVISVLHETVGRIDQKIINEPGAGERMCYMNAADYDLVIIYGGDGTVHECINGISLLDKRPIVAVLPGGTCNDFSRAIGVPEDLEGACRLLKTGVVRTIDLGTMNDRFFTNFLGIGMITDTSQNIDPAKKTMLGKMSYYLSALEMVRHPSFFYYMIEADGMKLEGEAAMIVALNGNYIGAFDLPFKADNEDGYLELIIVKDSGFPLVKEVLQTRKIKETGEHAANLEHHQVQSFTIQTNHPMQIDMDGEVYAVTPAVCGIKKRHIQVIGSP